MNETWMQVISLFLANAGLILWFRSESRADWRQMDAKLDLNVTAIRKDLEAYREETRTIANTIRAETKIVTDSIRAETKIVTDSIQAEMKDFHGRLCTIEERNREKFYDI